MSHVKSMCSIFKGPDDRIIPEIAKFESKLEENRKRLEQLRNFFDRYSG
ncbi:MAG: hypothetical protein WBZ36_14145 [Candidatus Nitrosopolaris sp.]